MLNKFKKGHQALPLSELKQLTNYFMKKLKIVIIALAFFSTPFIVKASCTGTFCGIIELECTGGACSVTVEEDGSGSMTCGGNTFEITCTEE